MAIFCTKYTQAIILQNVYNNPSCITISNYAFNNLSGRVEAIVVKHNITLEVLVISKAKSEVCGKSAHTQCKFNSMVAVILRF